jgi:hypothetical protein
VRGWDVAVGLTGIGHHSRKLVRLLVVASYGLVLKGSTPLPL